MTISRTDPFMILDRVADALSNNDDGGHCDGEGGSDEGTDGSNNSNSHGGNGSGGLSGPPSPFGEDGDTEDDD